MDFLTGSTFPLSLVRRKVMIAPGSIEEYLYLLKHGNWLSFWGHSNTLAIANQLTGVDLSPKEARPALSLNDQDFPALYGKEFRHCWILSPDYSVGFRPQIGQEVEAKDIQGWQVLHMEWVC